MRIDVRVRGLRTGLHEYKKGSPWGAFEGNAFHCNHPEFGL
jgi:hypothetical protein